MGVAGETLVYTQDTALPNTTYEMDKVFRESPGVLPTLRGSKKASEMCVCAPGQGVTARKYSRGFGVHISRC